MQNCLHSSPNTAAAATASSIVPLLLAANCSRVVAYSALRVQPRPTPTNNLPFGSEQMESCKAAVPALR